MVIAEPNSTDVSGLPTRVIHSAVEEAAQALTPAINREEVPFLVDVTTSGYHSLRELFLELGLTRSLVTSSFSPMNFLAVERLDIGASSPPPKTARPQEVAAKDEFNPTRSLVEEALALSGLPVGALIDTLGVSPSAYYTWMRGEAAPSSKRQAHILQIFVHLRDARQQLPRSLDMSTWLQTPVEAGEDSPLGFLRAGQYDLFRGFVIRETSRAAPLATPTPLGIMGSSISEDSKKYAAYRLNPPPRPVSDNDDDDDDDR